jgi:CHAT domain-containing protein
MRRLGLLALLFVAAALRGAEPDIRPFLNAIITSDAQACDPQDPESVSSRRWAPLRQTLARSECNVIHSWRILSDTPSGTGRLVELQLFVSGRQPITHREQQLSTRWFLQYEPRGDAWRLDSAIRLERHVALCMFAAPPEQADAILAAYPDADPIRLAIDLADEGSEPEHAFDGPPRIDFAIELTRRNGDVVAEAGCLRLASTAKLMADAPAEAVELARQSLAIMEREHNADGICAGHFSLALAEWKNNDFPGAFRDFEAAAAMISTTASPDTALKSLRMAAYVHQTHGDLREALIDAGRMAELSRQYGWLEGEIVAAISQSEIHVELRNYDVARRYLEAAYDLAHAHHERVLEIAIVADMGGSNLHDDPARAVAFLQKALDLSSGYDSPGITSIQLMTAIGLMDMGRLAEAGALLERVLGAMDPRVSRIRYEALTIRSQLRHLQGRDREALADAEEAILKTPIALAVETQWQGWTAHAAAGTALHALGRNEEARPHLQLAVSMIEAHRADAPVDEAGKVTYFADKLEPYQTLVEVLVDSGRLREAFTTAERMKGRALRDAIEQGRIDVSPTLTAEEKQQASQLDEKIAAANLELAAARDPAQQKRLAASLDDARAALRAFEAQLFGTHPQAGKRKIGRADERIVLPRSLQGVAVVEYVVGEERTIAFTVTAPDVVDAVVIPVTREQLTREIGLLVDSLSSRDVAFAARASRLYQLLLGRLPHGIGTSPRLCIIPDGPLWRVPFAALRDGDRFVIERSTVSYVQSLSIARDLEELPQRPADRSVLLAFGNPVLGAKTVAGVRSVERAGLVDTLGSLPDAETEVRSLGKLYGRSVSEIYVGEEAREATFKREASRFRVLHLATHAILDDQSPMYSALVLAPSGDDDGLLEAREIVDLQLNADLAVLSSCDSGGGAIGSGEGVIGMSWALLVAGCPTTIVTQWQVSSKSTAAMMIAFHQHLLAGQSKAAALRHAQLATMRTPGHRHPFYWGAFVAIGAAW